MPISVLCPGCQTRFNVSEKFAGKQGPCPKCKKILTVPDVPAEEIKIHTPEFGGPGAKDAKGRSVLKPIARVQTKLSPTTIVAIVGAIILTLAVALMMRFTPAENKTIIAAIGLVIVSPALALAAYSFLADDEGDPYRGRALYLRCLLCGWAYALLWAIYWPLTANGIITGEIWQWVFVIPVFVAAGAGISFATLDLDFGNAAMHYCFFLLVTILLRYAIGMPHLWDLQTGPPVPVF